MDKQNPYAPSRASLAGAHSGVAASEEGPLQGDAAAPPAKLANRSLRLFAVFLDGIVVAILTLPIYWYLHIWQDIWERHPTSFRISVILPAVWFATFAAVNYRLLAKHGQTVGKWIVGIAILGVDGTNKGAMHLLIYRFVPAMLFQDVPIVGWLFSLVDTFAIFGRDRRCLHDRIAGTKVIEAERL